MSKPRTCVECGGEFSPVQKHQRYCSKRCKIRADHRKSHARHREKHLAAMRAHYAENREKMNADSRQYYADHREELKSRQREYNAAHRDQVNAANRAQHHAKRAVRNTNRKAYYSVHKSKQMARQRERYFADHESSKRKERMRYQTSRAKTPWAKLLSGSRGRAKSRGIGYSLTNDWALSRWTGKCEITGIDFVCSKRAQHPFSPSIDRIDPKLGYTPENCRFVLMGVNALKGSGSDEDMVRIAKAISANYP